MSLTGSVLPVLFYGAITVMQMYYWTNYIASSLQIFSPSLKPQLRATNLVAHQPCSDHAEMPAFASTVGPETFCNYKRFIVFFLFYYLEVTPLTSSMACTRKLGYTIFRQKSRRCLDYPYRDAVKVLLPSFNVDSISLLGNIPDTTRHLLN